MNRQTAKDGEVPLTRRELEVLRMMADGMSNRRIADELGVSYHTVRNHVSAILTKLRVRNQEEAARIGRVIGLNED